ncbi:MAG: YhbY family RNA-binding protein, partial [Betaproteobacteria bacterium]|nr:YhbY family RNA-binding protein [Betaproteobacteria bacterium]
PTQHALIKVRVAGDDRETRQAMLEALCETLACAPVQSIGKLLVLYRPKDYS